MQTSPAIRLMTYFVIALGVMLSFACAAVPHFTAGYTLHLGVLFAGLLPYLIYGMFINLVRRGPLLAIGVRRTRTCLKNGRVRPAHRSTP